MNNRSALLLYLSLLSSGALAQDKFDQLVSNGTIDEQAERSSLNVLATAELGTNYRFLNRESRQNPGNKIFGIPNEGRNLKVQLEVWDTINEAKSARWLLKTYNLFDGEIDKSEQARIDEAFVDYSSGQWFFNVGKRRVNWGHAFAFNPVNVVVPPRNVLNPDQDTEGHPIIWARKGNEKWAADAIVTRNYDRNWYSTSTQWGARLSTVFDNFDTAIYYFDGNKDLLGNAYKRMLGASFSVDAGDGITVFGEIANFNHNDRNYYTDAGEVINNDTPYNEWIVGMNSRFGLENTLLFEFYHNNSGFTKGQRIAYLNRLDASTNDASFNVIVNDFQFSKMAQTYLLVGYEKTFRDNYNYMLRALFSEDGSSVFGMIGTYDFAQSYSGRIEWRHNQGGKQTEFGNDTLSDKVTLSLIVSM